MKKADAKQFYTARDVLEAVGMARVGKLQLSDTSFGSSGSGEAAGNPDCLPLIRAWDQFAKAEDHECREWAPVAYYGLKWPSGSRRGAGETRMRWLMRIGAAWLMDKNDDDLPRLMCMWLEHPLTVWLKKHPLRVPQREYEAA